MKIILKKSVLCFLLGGLGLGSWIFHPNSYQWLGKTVYPERLKDQVHTYHMFDSTRRKVGSMVFGWKQEDGFIRVRDTSQLDDGSMYETLEMKIDTKTLLCQKLNVEFKTPDLLLKIALRRKEQKLMGSYQFRNADQNREKMIDSLLVYDLFREEIYALMHSIDYEKGDQIPFKMMMSNSLQIVDAWITYEKEAEIEVPAGRFQTDVLYLNSGGLIDNRIWLSQSEPKKIVKFYVPSVGLDIELIKTEK